MPVPILLTLLLLGLGVVILQTRNKKKGFMPPGQNHFVGMVGVITFLGLTFVSIMMLFY